MYVPVIPEGTAIWPVSVSGWISLVLSVAAVVSVAIGYGRWLEKLNGMGRRVDALEAHKQRSDGAEIERIRVMERVLGQHEDLIRQIGEAKQMAQDANQLSEDNVSAVRIALDGMTRSVNDMRLDLSQRLTRVETKLT